MFDITPELGSGIDRRRAFIINVVYWALIAVIIFFAVKYLLDFLMPLLIGFIIAFCLNPLVKFVVKKTSMPRGPVATAAVVLFYLLIGSLITLLGIWLFGVIYNFVIHLPEYYDSYILPTLQRLESIIVENVGMLVPEWSQDGSGSSILAEITKFISSFSSNGITFLANFTAGLPMILLSCIFTILSSLFMTIYYNEFTGFILKQVSERTRSLVADVRKVLTDTLLKYLLAYLKIMSITYVELAVGLTILQVPMSLLVALGIAVFDILPVLGTGGILVPWIILSLINQQYMFALGMAILYVVILVVRNFMEPRIVGQQLGLNPLVALASIYVGLVTMGVGGMLLVPVTVQIILTLHRQGKINFIKF